MQPILEIDEYGTKRWKLNGERHREDGPAVEYPDGRKDWYLDGKCVNLEYVIKEYSDGYGPWTSHDLVKFKLKYM